MSRPVQRRQRFDCRAGIRTIGRVSVTCPSDLSRLWLNFNNSHSLKSSPDRIQLFANRNTWFVFTWCVLRLAKTNKSSDVCVFSWNPSDSLTCMFSIKFSLKNMLTLFFVKRRCVLQCHQYRSQFEMRFAWHLNGSGHWTQRDNFQMVTVPKSQKSS